MKRISGILIASGAFVLGGAIAAVILYDKACEPPTRYVLELSGAEFASPTPVNEAAFINAVSVQSKKAVFRRGLRRQSSDTAPSTTPIGYIDAGLTSSGCAPAPDGGMHVTQRVGFDNQKNLQEALALLKK